MRIRKRLATISAGLGGLHHVQRPAAGPVCSPLRMPSQPMSRAGCNSSELHVAQEEGSSKSASHVYKKQVDIPTATAGTAPQFRRNPTPTSPSIQQEDHVTWPKHMSTDEESGVLSCTARGENDGDLQRLARDLIRINVKASIKASACKEDKVLKSGILRETSANFKQNNARINGSRASSDALHNVEERNKQDQGGDEDERCCRRSGRGWQCKNTRAADGSSIYCNYHQLKIHQNHASWNARIKTMKENKRKRKISESEASFQSLQNKMVDVKMFELPLLPSKQHMYENVQAHDAISSEAGAIFKRMFQAAASTEKRELSNMGTDHDLKPTQNSIALPSLVDTVVLPTRPSALHAQVNSESQGLGNANFKRRRVEKVAEAPECTVVDDGKCNDGGSMLSSEVEQGVADADEYCGARKEELDQEIMRCKRMDGKGWQCRNMHGPNSTYCYHHQLQKRGHKGRSQRTHLVTGINTSTAAQSMINPSCSVQGPEDGDASNLQTEVGTSMEDDRAQGEMYENGRYQSERGKSKIQQGLQAGFQDDMEHGFRDTNAHNGLHFRQLQQEQLQWWEYKQGGKDSTLISEKDHNGKQADLLLPRRSERRLIIDICKSTAAEHAKDKMGTHDHERPRLQSNDMAANNDELLQRGISYTSYDMIPAAKSDSHDMEPIDMNDAQKIQKTEQQQCKRHDGRGWQCKRKCVQGKFYCEHHLEMQRNYVEKTDAKGKGKVQRVAKHALKSEENISSNEPALQTIVVKKMDCGPHKQQVRKGSCRVQTDLGSTAKHTAKHGSDDVKEQMKQVQRGPQKLESNGLQGLKSRAVSQGSCKRESNEVHKQEQLAVAELPRQEPEGNDKQEQELKLAEADKGQHRCGRHDGRGWQCKSMCKQGSLYCEYHREKLRRNHATWNAKKLQEKQSSRSLLAAGKRKLCMEDEAAAVPAQQVIDEEDRKVQEKLQEKQSNRSLLAAGKPKEEAAAPAQQVIEDEERKVQENVRAGKNPLAKKKTRSLLDIVARSAT